VRHQLGLGFEGSTHPRLFYVADVEMTLDIPDSEINNDGSTLIAALGENAYVLMAPMKGDNHWRFTGNVPDFDPTTTTVASAKTSRLTSSPSALNARSPGR
jgi:hypothetical protein